MALKVLKALFVIASMLLLSGCHTTKRVTVTPADKEMTKEKVTAVNKQISRDRQAIVEEAYRWIGVPYRLGGNTRKGTDCSGLVTQVYLKATGKKLPRTTVEQDKFCITLKKKELMAGDLVFFSSKKGGGRISHVGLYIGDDKMIHASSSRGVMVSRIDDIYFGPRYKTAGRVPGISNKKKNAAPATDMKEAPVPVMEVTLEELDDILQEKVDSISNSLLFE